MGWQKKHFSAKLLYSYRILRFLIDRLTRSGQYGGHLGFVVLRK